MTGVMTPTYPFTSQHSTITKTRRNYRKLTIDTQIGSLPDIGPMESTDVEFEGVELSSEPENGFSVC